jgi:predicted chitinase
MKLQLLKELDQPLPSAELSAEQVKELQRALALLGYPVGEADGLIGPKTRSAWAEFKTDVFEGNPALIGPESMQALQGRLEAIATLQQHDFSTKNGTIAAIIQACKAQGIGLKTQVAYVLATTQWETAQTFKPVKEAYWKSEDWRQQNFKYYPYYGRGFVQLTWENNYNKYADILGADLVSEPDKAMDPNIALFVLTHGFKNGVFTGHKLAEYVNEHNADFASARRCINGTDRAEEIAKLARSFLTRLETGELAG